MSPRTPWLAAALVAGVAACVHGSGATTGPGPLPTDGALAPVDDRAAFAHLDPLLDAATDSAARVGNHVELLVDGVTSFDRRLANARDADLILVKTFAFLDDETGREVAALLSARARAGAYVVLQYDVTGSLHGAGDAEEMLANHNEKRMISDLRAAGVVVVAANAPAGPMELREISGAVGRAALHPFEHLGMLIDRAHHLDFRDHEKYWITGRRDAAGRLALRAIMGGLNIGSEYAFGGTPRVDRITGARGWHDADAEVTGPVVNDIVARYFDVMDDHLGRPHAPELRARWNEPQPYTGAARVRFVFNHPWFANRHAIEELYGALIDAVPPGGVVRIETAYFVPSERLRAHLRAALARGTRLLVISNLDTNDTAPVAEGTWFAYDALLGAGGVAALYQRIARPDLGGVMVHCKVASFGTAGPVFIGSANLDAQSGEHNSEGVLVIEDPGFRPSFDQMLERDYGADRAARITRDSLARDSTWQQLRRWGVWHLGEHWL